MKKKRRGSSAIAVVIIFSLIIMVGSSMLSMTLGDYKMRINETARIKNLYSADSGLDAAYDIMVKTFDAAAKYGVIKADEFNRNNIAKEISGKFKEEKGRYEFETNKVEFCSENGTEYLSKEKDIDEQNQIIKNCNNQKKKKDADIKELNKTIKQCEKIIQDDENRIEELKNIEFKRAFKAFIYKDSNEESTEEKINNLARSIHDFEYIDGVNKGDEGKIKLSYLPVKLNNDEHEKPNIYIPNDDNEKGIELIDDKSYKIKIRSEFLTSHQKITNQKGIGQNKKVLEANYTMNIPERKDVSFSNGEGKVKQLRALQNKAIIVNRDMIINGNTTSDGLKVKGDVYVCGDKDVTSNTGKAYEKYNGGIQIDKSKTKFQGNIMTARTFNIEDNSNTTINGNLYAKNIYAGKVNGGEADSSNLTISGDSSKGQGQAVIDNDIAVKAKNSQVTINEFYGINDKNIDGDKLNATSSSIIVNGNYTTSVKVNDKAYIMGVANINTDGDGYVTGESTGIKGNYIAYAARINSDDKFKNYDPLMLIDKDDSSNSIDDKMEHFKAYWNTRLGSLNYGGIELPKDNTFAVGAIVCKGSNNQAEIRESSSLGDLESTINTKREEYAKKIYSLVQDETINEDSLVGEETPEQNSENKYDPTKNVTDVLSEIIDFNPENKSNTYDISSQESNEEKMIFNNDEDKTIEIVQDSSIPGKYKIEQSTDLLKISTKDGNLNAVIVTNGELNIKDNVKIKGTVICNKNLNLSSNNTSIEYDEDLVKRIQSDNKELFNDIFVPIYSNVDIDENSDFNTAIEVDYDINKFIKSNLWKIIK